MRLLYLLAAVALTPVFFPATGISEERPGTIAGLSDWFFETVLETARWQWIALALFLFVTPLVSNLVRAGLQRILESRYGFLSFMRETDAGTGIQRSASVLVAAFLWSVVLPFLDLPDGLGRIFHYLLQGSAVLGLVWLVYSIWDAICDNLTARAAVMGRRTERLLVPITRKLVQALIFIGGLLLALASFGVNVTAVVTGLGVGGLIIALAAKDSVENVFGSLTILFDMPFAIGDWVRIGAVEGSVEEINLRSTRIRTSEDSVITLPNSNLIRASVENLGARRHHRVKTTFSVSAQLPAERISALVDKLRETIKNHPKTRKTGFQVEVYEFTFTEVQIMVNFFINASNYTEELRHRGELLLEFKRAAEEMGIESLSAPAPAEEPREAVPPTAEEQSAVNESP
jgi:MscS family membrane protein